MDSAEESSDEAANMGDTGNVKPTPALARKTFCVPYGSKWLAKHNC